MRATSNASRTGLPSIEANMSPGRTPTSAAGLFGVTRAADTPASESAHMIPSSGTPKRPRSTQFTSESVPSVTARMTPSDSRLDNSRDRTM